MADPVDSAAETEKEKIRLIESDLDRTNEFIKGVLGTSAALRGSAITIWLALMGFAAQQVMPILAFLAAVVAVMFWLADGYHGWLYGQAFFHVRRIERLLADYYNNLSRRQDSARIHRKFTARLRAHRYGLYGNFAGKFTPNEIFRSARPYLFYRVLYPALVLLALALGVVVLCGVNLKVGAVPVAPARVVIDGPVTTVHGGAP